MPGLGVKSRVSIISEKYFKKCRISLLAMIRMLQHAKKGGDIEVMGYFRGRIQGDTYIVLDAFPLPVEGTETRVNAGREAEEYTARIDDLCEIVKSV
jgi:COP9 signalosome complex subunit 5